jgi:hypothetical protein
MFVYLDDIIILSRSLDQHLERMSIILGRLINAELKLKPNKCHLLQHSVEFLVNIVSAERIAPHRVKIVDVLRWKVSRCLRDVRASLCLPRWVLSAVRHGFSVMAAPL